ncbi:uncharacterized protein LOC127724589 [Mytilus californianus]|uniref:uncharacterized protein LOC127724589 n=1 Tax=Mytilus californianus TaxID=6549 RepID=UPI0022481210|nr:uncharacterized protein LOC127724589 [Mytilus californianus]
MVTFIGGPGSGKTATGRHIALLFERLGWEVIPVYNEDEIVRYGNGNIRQVFLLDDVLGSFALDLSRLNNIVSCKKTILNSINNRSKIVFTCRKTVYNEAIGLKPFVLKHIVDLESKTNDLNELEKIQILTNHCLKAGIDKKLYINLSLTSAKIMFPFLCQLFAANVKYQMFGSDFFERPFDYLLEEMSKLQKTNTAQYVSLVLCLVNNRKLSKENLPFKNVKKRIYNSCGLDRGTADRKIIDALSHIEGTYVVLIESEYSFIHDSIYEAIAFHYGQVFPEQILEYMPSDFISSKVIVFGNSSFDELSIKITEKYFSNLAERIYSDLESNQLFDVFMNKALKYEPFLDVFIQLMKKKPYNDFKKTFLGHKFSFFGDCDHLINTQEKDKDHEEEAGSTYYDETFKRALLTDKREGEFEDKNLRYNIHRILVISWVVYFGHIRLLQEIVRHVHDHNESTDLVFGSSTEEQARLLVLSVYNGDPGLIETILKYVKKKSINSTSMYMDDDFLEANHHRTLSPLTAACQFNNFKIVELLVRAGADVNLADFDYEFPILMLHQRMDIMKS